MGLPLGVSRSAPAQSSALTAEVGIASFPPVLATNAYQRLLYAHLAPCGLTLVHAPRFHLGWLRSARRRVGILHFHWIQPYYAYERGPRPLRFVLGVARLTLFAGRLAAARRLGYRIVWTIHQTRPHDSQTPRLDRLASAVLARAAHLLVAHDRATAVGAARELRLRRRVQIVPHGSYVGVYPEGRPRAVVRQELGIAPDACVFLAFGLIRRYKEVDLLVEAFRDLADERAALVVAGMPLDAEAAATLTEAARVDTRICPLLEFVPDDRVAELYEAADVAVVTRGDGGSSGALLLAISLGRPVVAAATATYGELLLGGQAGWLFEPGSRSSLTAALAAAAADPATVDQKGSAARRRADDFRWGDIARRLAELMTPDAARGG